MAFLLLSGLLAAGWVRLQKRAPSKLERLATVAGTPVARLWDLSAGGRCGQRPRWDTPQEGDNSWDAPFSPAGQQEVGVGTLVVGLFMLLVVMLAHENGMTVDMAPGWDIEEETAVTEEVAGEVATASNTSVVVVPVDPLFTHGCPEHSTWDTTAGQCVCDDTFICEGCYDAYPRDEGFLMEKVGRTFVCVPECSFSQGVVDYGTLRCTCADGFEATATRAGWGATGCVPSVPCSRNEQCSPNAACALLGRAGYVCVCNRHYWSDSTSRTPCTRWTECDFSHEYMMHVPDALTDRTCRAATPPCPHGERTPLQETRDRTCCTQAVPC